MRYSGYIMDRTRAATPIGELTQIGGNRCLDLANTLVAAEPPRDSLTGIEAFRAWASRAGIAVEPSADPRADGAALRRLRRLRDAIRAIAAATVSGAPCPPDAAETLTEAAARSFRSRRLGPRPGGIGWQRLRRDLDSVTDLLAMEAVALFADAEGLRLKRCMGAHCGWFFIDRSRNGSRRWCSMADCGNRTKARRHRARQRA